MTQTVVVSSVSPRFAVLGLALGACALAQAQEYGRVLSSTPVVQQVAVPRQVCTQQQVSVPQQKTGAGAVIGAIAGGAVGNAFGRGSGRAAATFVGAVGGAILGDHIEGSPSYAVQNVQTCSTQTFYENRAIAYNVVYEYAGKQYSVQMPQDPGPHVQLQITPVGGSAPPPVVQAPAPLTVVHTAPAPVWVAPAVVTVPAVVYPRPSVSINLGYTWHRRSHGQGHGHGHGYPHRYY